MRGRPGRPRLRAESLVADRGYDHHPPPRTPQPDRARELLDQAGWKLDGTLRRKGGRTLELRFVIPTGIQTSRQEGELTQAMLTDVGVKLDVRTVPSDDFFDRYVIPGNYDLTPFSWLGTPYPISSAASIYGRPRKDSKGELQIQQNFARVGSEEIDRLMTSAQGSSTRPRRVSC